MAIPTYLVNKYPILSDPNTLAVSFQLTSPMNYRGINLPAGTILEKLNGAYVAPVASQPSGTTLVPLSGSELFDGFNLRLAENTTQGYVESLGQGRTAGIPTLGTPKGESVPAQPMPVTPQNTYQVPTPAPSQSVQNAPQPTQSFSQVNYTNLINKSGTIYNTITGKGYATPEELARDLGITSDKIDWSKIPSQVSSSVSPQSVPQPQGQQQTSLVDIYTSRPDLQRAFPNALQPGTPNNQALNDWWNQYGTKEYPNTQLIAPGNAGITNPISSPAQPQNNTSQSPVVTPSVLPSTGNPQVDAMLKEFQTFLETQKANGQKINPDIELSPATLQEFYDQASKEISPYFANQFESIKGELQKNLDTLQKQYNIEKESMASQFRENLLNSREKRAQEGTYFSGARGAEEQQLANAQQRQLDLGALEKSNTTGNLLSNTAQQIGSRNLRDLTLPTYNTPKVTTDVSSLLNGGFNEGNNTPYYNPPDITGSLERQRTTDILARQNQLEEAARQNRARQLPFYNGASIPGL